MAHGCPAVVSDIPSLRERCADAAVYCDPEDVDSIVAATVRLLDNPTAWEKQRDVGLLKATQYSWSAQARAVIAKVLKEERG